MELKDREFKNKETEELFLKLITLFIEDMDKFEQNKMKKKIPIKSTQYNWLIKYIPENIKRTVSGFKR